MELRKSPQVALFLLSFINLFNYLDRFILVALTPAIQKELMLTDTQVGILVSAFLWIYFLASPLMGWLGDRGPRFLIIAAGVAVWSLATAGAAYTSTFAGLLAVRALVGAGEAAYGSIAPAILSDLFPREKRGRAFSFFFMAIPVGSALGFLLGGYILGFAGWRWAFFAAGLPGLVLAFLLSFLKDPERGAQENGAGAAESPQAAYAALARNGSFVYSVLGYAAYTFVVGGVAAWIPHYMERFLGMPASTGNMSFGAVTVVAGFLGTFVGGAWADRWAKRSPDAYLKLSALTVLLSAPVYALVLLIPSTKAFLAAVFVLEFLLFLSTSPINAQTVNCVSPALRATASALTIFFIHLFGDALSPTMVGMLSDSFGLRFGMWLFFPVLLLSGGLWLYKVIFLWEPSEWPKGFVLPTAQGHRGMHIQGVPENTLQAFREAAARGAKMVELDVRLAKGAVPVIVHDQDLERIAGRKMLVAESTPAELEQVGQVPSLEKLLCDPACASLKINVELKCETAKATGLEPAVARVIESVPGARVRILFSSFNPVVLHRMAELLPDVPRALLVTEEDDPQNKIYLRKMWLAFWARPHILNLDQEMINPALVKKLEQRQIPFAVWTVADPAKARALLASGAKSIISPDPNIV